MGCFITSGQKRLIDQLFLKLHKSGMASNPYKRRKFGPRPPAHPWTANRAATAIQTMMRARMARKRAYGKLMTRTWRRSRQSLISAANGVHTFIKRLAIDGLMAPKNDGDGITTAPGYAFELSLSQFTAYGELTALFDQYRIVRFDFQFFPCCNVNSPMVASSKLLVFIIFRRLIVFRL